MAKKKKNWIPKDLKKGTFTEYCKKQGYKGVTNECIKKGLKSKNPKTRSRAKFAKAARSMAKKRKRGK